MSSGRITFSHCSISLLRLPDGSLRIIRLLEPDVAASRGTSRLKISVSVENQFNIRSILNDLKDSVQASGITWFWRLSVDGDWCVDLDGLASWINDPSFAPCGGKVRATPKPQFSVQTRGDAAIAVIDIQWLHPSLELEEEDMAHFPELTPSLENFAIDHPDPKKCAFVMMRFAKLPIHEMMLSVIVDTCKEFGVTALRSDQHEYSNDVLMNIRTYMHGCAYGIAVFERLESDEFNPNVSLEHGYMMALRKPVCLLKDKNLRTLNTDIGGLIYRPFDTQNVSGTMPDELRAWLKNYLKPSVVP